jgi:hypothetical protein
MPLDRQPNDLVINPDPFFPEVDFASDDVLFNCVTSNTQLRNDGDGMPGEGPMRSQRPCFISSFKDLVQAMVLLLI